ncbi:MAG: DUF4290 domain-containing protein [Candidatus Azobacteroides sp.]|nr:DUF4290 domain-containing protein [Candidatus Azobacteroides sp.]
MNYNTQQQTLVLPEYGRNIQNMVDYAVNIKDRKERQRCAESIINIMGNLFPYLRDVNDFRHKLWDHLAIMSDFKLDIDYPCEIMKKENLHTRPDKIPYKIGYIKYRYYGRTLEKMIQKLGEFSEEEQGKEVLTSLLANHMKKSFLTWNKEMVNDEKIFKDMDELSQGKIKIDQDFLKLRESKDILQRRNKNNNNNNNDKRRTNR